MISSTQSLIGITSLLFWSNGNAIFQTSLSGNGNGVDDGDGVGVAVAVGVVLFMAVGGGKLVGPIVKAKAIAPTAISPLTTNPDQNQIVAATGRSLAQPCLTQ